jgi:hypothetical protein
MLIAETIDEQMDSYRRILTEQIGLFWKKEREGEKESVAYLESALHFNSLSLREAHALLRQTCPGTPSYFKIRALFSGVSEDGTVLFLKDSGGSKIYPVAAGGGVQGIFSGTGDIAALDAEGIASLAPDSTATFYCSGTFLDDGTEAYTCLTIMLIRNG